MYNSNANMIDAILNALPKVAEEMVASYSDKNTGDLTSGSETTYGEKATEYGGAFDKQVEYDTYEKFLREQGIKYADYKDATYNEAETARLRAENDASFAYQQNKSTYGANADALARMGLTGSGYGDYLDSQAYAAYRGEVANAVATEAQTKRAADNTYADNMTKLDSTIAEYRQNVEADQEATYEAWSAEISTMLNDPTHQVDFNLIKQDKETGKITEPQYNNLKTQWERQIDVDNFFRDENGYLISSSSAKKALEAIQNHPWYNKDFNIDDKYKELYAPGQSITFILDKKITFNNDNFSVKDEDGNKYRIQYAGGEVHDDIKNFAISNVRDGEVFRYGNNLYIRHGQKAYKIEARSHSYSGHWTSLCGKFGIST